MGYLDGGYCAYIAAGIVLLYYDYFRNSNIIEDLAFLDNSGSTFSGSTFTRILIDIGIDILGYDDGGISVGKAVNVMMTYLENRGISMNSWKKASPSVANIINQLNLGRPVIYGQRMLHPDDSSVEVNHGVVIYGYTPNETLICHFGWPDYYSVYCIWTDTTDFSDSAGTIYS